MHVTDSVTPKRATWRTFVVFGALLLGGYLIAAGAFVWAEHGAESCRGMNAAGLVVTFGVYFATAVALFAMIRRVALLGLWIAAFVVSAAAALLMTLLALIAMGLSCPDPALERTQNALEKELLDLVESQTLGLTVDEGVETDCPRVLNVTCDRVGSSVRFERTSIETDSCEAVWRLQQEHTARPVLYGELELRTAGQPPLRERASTPADPRILSACQRLVARDRVFAVVMPIEVAGTEGDTFSRITTGGDATAWEDKIVLAYTDYGTL